MPLRENRILGISEDLGKQKTCLTFNMLNLKAEPFIPIKISRLMMQIETCHSEQRPVSTRDAVLGNVLVAQIAEATGWVSGPLGLGAVHMVSLVKVIAQQVIRFLFCRRGPVCQG